MHGGVLNGAGKFPAAGLAAVKDRTNAIALAPVEKFRRDSDLLDEGSKAGGAERFAAALKRGFQTRSVELDLARFLGDLSEGPNFSLASQ
jgi:hypothetical protein